MKQLSCQIATGFTTYLRSRMEIHPSTKRIGTSGRRLEDGGPAQARLVAEDDPVGSTGRSPDHSRGPARRFRGSKNMAPSRGRARGDQTGEGDMESSPPWIGSGRGG